MMRHIKAKALVLISLLLSSSSLADEHVKLRSVAKQLQPALSETDASAIAGALVSVREAGCDIEWPLLLSIAYNESSLRKSTVNPKTKDYGIMQINEKTIARLGMNKNKVMSDVRYALQKGCDILMWNRGRYAKRYHYWLGIYRSGVMLHKKEIRDNARSYDRIIRATAARIEDLLSEKLVSSE